MNGRISPLDNHALAVRNGIIRTTEDIDFIDQADAGNLKRKFNLPDDADR